MITFFQTTKIFYIATIEENKPRVRPFGNIMNYQDNLYINSGKKKRFYQQVTINPYVEICAFDKGVWYRVEAKLVEVSDKEIFDKMLAEDAFVKKHYENQIDNLAIFRLDEVKAYRNRFDGSVQII